MKISYVLPVFNADHILAITLRSLIKQTHTDKEIIVIDDGSTDYSHEIIEHFKDDIDIIFVNEIRKGAAYSRNLGKSVSRGDIIAVCDCDSYTKHRGEILEKFFEKGEFGVFHSSVKCVDSFDPSKEWIQDAMEWDFNSKCPISHPTVAYTKQIAQEFNYHETTIDSDLYEFFLLDVAKAGHKFGGAQDVTCIKLEGDTKRDKKSANEIKKKMYEERDIAI